MNIIENLELKYISPYLLCNLKFKINKNKIQLNSENYEFMEYPENTMPILRPLSDLTKEIKIKGFQFIPVDFLAEMLTNTQMSNFNLDFAKEWILQLKITELPYFIVQKLLEWHFDIFELIENNLAIDYNCL